jgi:putative transposase
MADSFGCSPQTRLMPWKKSCPMTERMKFISRLIDGESMSSLCREFGISRPTGYKFKKRFEEFGIDGFRDLSRRPRGHVHQIPRTKIDTIVALRERYGWGPVKLRRRLEDLYPDQQWPAKSTIAIILKREGYARKRKRRRRANPSPLPLDSSKRPNDLWSMDFKGQFRTLDRVYCYPLTVCDHHSRYLLCCEALANTRTAGVKEALADLFTRQGLPDRIRTDNGSPFASTNKLGLTRLAVWLLRQGIELERIQPGHPEQNGRHERMHRTLKAETTRPAEANLLCQQERFDAFVDCFNNERPHEALTLDTPAKHYIRSKRKYELPELPISYSGFDAVCNVYSEGDIYISELDKTFFLGAAFAGERVGLKKLSSATWAVTFVKSEIGYLDVESRQFLVDLPIEMRVEAKHRGHGKV